MKVYKMVVRYKDTGEDILGYAITYEDTQSLFEVLGKNGAFSDAAYFIAEEVEYPTGFLLWGTLPDGMQYILGEVYKNLDDCKSNREWLLENGIPESDVHIEENVEKIFTDE